MLLHSATAELVCLFCFCGLSASITGQQYEFYEALTTD